MAFFEEPEDERIAVKHDPISAPRHMNTAVPAGTTPYAASVWSTPTDADELCIIPVTTIPIRIPRRGFNNARFTVRYAIVNVSDLNRFEDGSTVTPEMLKEAGLVKKELNGIKILGSGELTKKLTVKANIFTNGAINKIESNGGKVEVI